MEPHGLGLQIDVMIPDADAEAFKEKLSKSKRTGTVEQYKRQR